MKKTFKRVLIIVLGLVIACMVLIALAIGPKLINMKSEYMTAGVIRDTQEFVEKTKGEWPSSWQDLGNHDFTSCTRMNFDVNPALATKQDVMSAISPQSGKYLTYPHAEAQLKALFKELKSQREEIRTTDITVPSAGAF